MEGHPKPRATVGGKASGNDEAEKKEIERVGTGDLSDSRGGKRFLVASSIFSGMYRKDGMLYLPVFQ